MTFEVRIPSLGESVTEAAIGRWLRADGERVELDEPLLELESDKANMELAAEATGILHLVKAAGETVGVGDVVARIEATVASAEPPAAASAAAATRPAATTAPAAQGTPGAAVAPRAPSSAVVPNTPATAAATGLAIPSLPARDATGRPLAPSVQRIVEESGLEPGAIHGSGPGGRISKADALAAANSGPPSGTAGGSAHPKESPPAAARSTDGAAPPAVTPAAPSAATPAPTPTPERGQRHVKMSRIRQVIARRLVEAQHTAAILTTFNEIDMSSVMELRRLHKDAFEKRHGVALGFMSFFARACCAAARAVPELNAEIRGDELVYRDFVHLGIAVGTEHGLVVPVVRDADQLSFAGIEREIVRLAALARDGHLTPDHLSGATFTISNGGIYGSLLSTPILNPPQSGILGMHKIEKRPVVVADEIVVRPMMYLALSYDHRVVDGKGAVTFLVRVKEALEDPTRLLLDV